MQSWYSPRRTVTENNWRTCNSITEQTKKTEAEQETARVEAETAVIKAKAEAESNKVLAESITENLIRFKEAEARMEHGWAEIEGVQTVVTTDK